MPLGLWRELAEVMVVYFYNPNIRPQEEYIRRLADARLVSAEWQAAMIEGKYLKGSTDAFFREPPDHGASPSEAPPGAGIGLAPLEELPADIQEILQGGDVEEIKSDLRPFGDEPEGGMRCELCYKLRLSRTAAMTRRLGLDAFATTLTISPHKNPDTVNTIGELAGKRFGVDYIWTNFKKREGFKKSVLESKRLGLYRQYYCGCEWSRREGA